MTENLISLVEQHLYQELFIHDLNWSAPDHPPISYTNAEGRHFTATNVSSYKGLRVWVCDQKPGSKVEAELDRLIAKTSTDRLVIFHNDDEQVWRWPARRNKDNSTSTRLTSHRHRTSTANPKFSARLDAIRLPTDVALDANAVLARVRDAFDVEAQNETKRASKLMARMYAAIEKSYPKNFDDKTRDHEISVTLARVLFLMFGDDTEMWETDAFRNFIHHDTSADGSTFADQLNELFAQLDTPSGSKQPRVAGLPYVNGGIFRERITLPALDREFRDAVLDACAVDWSTISPAIFGSMFQSVRDAETRRELGEHYTSEENILKTLNPLFLDELRAEFDRARTMKDEKGVLTRLWNRLGEIRFMDPACGCGNFIIVAYRELRDLELRIMERLQEVTGDAQLAFDPTLALKVTLDHFYGIEIDEWPARIAETAMFLVDRQCDLKLKERFGEAPQRLPIQTQASVRVSSSLTTDWAEFVGPTGEMVIAGNPPFKGGLKLNPDQSKDRTLVYNSISSAEGLRTGRIDFVCAWFAKASEFLKTREARCAFVATNSITQGEQARTLGPLMTRQGVAIDFAYEAFKWTSEAAGQAAVHVVIIGFSRAAKKSSRKRFLFSAENNYKPILASEINWWLAAAPHVEIKPRRTPFIPGLPRMTVGSQPTDGGNLIVDESEMTEVRDDPIASKYLRRYMGAKEMMQGKMRWCLWLTDASTSDIDRSPELSKRIQAVATERSTSPTKSFRETPAHLFTHRKHPSVPYIALPQNSTDARKWIPAAIFDVDTVASNKATIVYPAEKWMLALLQSQMYQTWVRMIGGRLKSDPTITADLSYNSYPWPILTKDSKRALTIAADDILAIREQQGGNRSLGRMYDSGEMPQDLITAHEKLDRIVDSLYGCDSGTEEDRKSVLFLRYQELANAAD